MPRNAFVAAPSSAGAGVPAKPRSSRDLEAFCRDLRLSARLLRLDVPTPTVPAAAEALGVAVDRIVKSLVFLVAGEPTLVIAAGEERVSYAALARTLGVSRRVLRFASAAQALAITGYRIGAMPPFGHLRPLRTLLDDGSMPTDGVVYGGGGDVSALLEVDVNELTTVTGARKAALT
ncbi:MAG: YbaK/EbsC family protein [Trueperaceae bacterium]